MKLKIKKLISLPNGIREFYIYQLSTYRKYIGNICFILGLLNTSLLIPDLILVDGTAKKWIIVLSRVVFSSLIFLFAYKIRKIHNLTVLFRFESALELLAILEFLLIFDFYNQPDFMIQTMGMIIINIIVFLIPNRWMNMLIISVSGTSLFLLDAWMMKPFKAEELLAGVVYLALVIFLCSIFALELNQYQFREFVSKKELIELSSTDPLTHAWNRNRLLDEFSRFQTYCNKRYSHITLALFDIDRFKEINDKNGHSVADTVLVEMVKLINGSLRRTDFLIRWGGDEFILLFPDTSLQDAVIIIERIRKLIENDEFVHAVKITCSFGAAEQMENFNLDVLIHQADDLMYEAKRLGGNHVSYHVLNA